MHVADRHTAGALVELEKSEHEARGRLRLRTLVLAKQGWTAPRIAAALGLSRRTVQRCVERYNGQGLAVIDDLPGRGRKPKLPEAQAAALLARIDAGPTQADEACALRGRDIQRIVRVEFGVPYSLNAIYAWLDRHGYRCLMPRPRHEESDPAAQEAFKKSPRPAPGHRRGPP